MSDRLGCPSCGSKNRGIATYHDRFFCLDCGLSEDGSAYHARRSALQRDGAEIMQDALGDVQRTTQRRAERVVGLAGVRTIDANVDPLSAALAGVRTGTDAGVGGLPEPAVPIAGQTNTTDAGTCRSVTVHVADRALVNALAWLAAVQLDLVDATFEAQWAIDATTGLRLEITLTRTTLA